MRPNILLITLDDMGPTAGCWGDHTVPTPNIDRLAAEGICFTRGYSTHSSCSPARSCLYTGLYTHQKTAVAWVVVKPVAEPARLAVAVA